MMFLVMLWTSLNIFEQPSISSVDPSSAKGMCVVHTVVAEVNAKPDSMGELAVAKYIKIHYSIKHDVTMSCI